MKTKSKYLLGILAGFIVIAGIVMYGTSGGNFLGMVRYSDSAKTPSTNLSTTIKSSDLRSITENSFVKQLINQKFENIEVKTSWNPGKYRKDSNKALIKIYPFQTIKFAEEIKDFIFTPFTKWRNAGVKGVGVVTSVDYAKQNHTHLLMGTEASGIYRSTNFGQSWTKLNNFPTYIINRVAIDPNNENHYLAIADWFNLYESFDKGNSWQLNRTIESLQNAPQDLQWHGNTIFIRVGKNSLVSQNNGKNWSSHILPFGAGYVRIKESGNGAAIGPSTSYDTIDDSFYITTNFGQTWMHKLDSTNNEKISAFDISTDGMNIVVGRYDENAKEISFAKSSDGGNNWQYTVPPNQGYTAFWPQDISLNDDNPNYFAMFVYAKMGSFYTTIDGGQTLTTGRDNIDEYDTIPFRQAETEEASLISPNDLRFNHMVKIVEAIPLYKSDLLDQTKTRLINEDIFKESAPRRNTKDETKFEFELPTVKKELYLLPTDQGLFAYDKSLRKMTNLVKTLYLGDTGNITVTSCPRIYAGLWHVGYFFIDSNGSVRGYHHSEKGGATAGEDLGCNTPIMYSQGMYSPYGTNIDTDVSYWIMNTLQITGIGHLLFHYHDGWWYVKINTELFRLNIPNRQIEQIPLPSGTLLQAFTINDDGSNTIYWIITKWGSQYSFWNSQDLQNWTLFKEVNNLQDALYNESVSVNNEGEYFGSSFVFDKLAIYGSQILLSKGLAVAVSNDFGNTWHEDFIYAITSNIVKDYQGRLFVGLSKTSNTVRFYNGNKHSGVWYSVDHGVTWNLLEAEAEKSQVVSLALNQNNNILYAGTKGESLLQFNLNDYNLPVPPLVMLRFSENELDYKLLEL